VCRSLYFLRTESSRHTHQLNFVTVSRIIRGRFVRAPFLYSLFMPSSDSLADLFEAEWNPEQPPDVDSFFEKHPEASTRDRMDIILVD